MSAFYRNYNTANGCWMHLATPVERTGEPTLKLREPLLLF